MLQSITCILYFVNYMGIFYPEEINSVNLAHALCAIKNFILQTS